MKDSSQSDSYKVGGHNGDNLKRIGGRKIKAGTGRTLEVEALQPVKT